VPHGRAPGSRDPGAWGVVPGAVDNAWAALEPDFTALCRDYPKLGKTNNRNHLGTLGTGNHFIEVCLDEAGAVWFMLHSGSRGVGNAIGSMFIEMAKQDAMRNDVHLPDADLAYFEEGSLHFRDYVRAVGWAQKYAEINRESDDASRARRGAQGAAQALREPRRGSELPSQLRAEGASLRRGRLRHAQGRGEREGRAARHHPRQHGRPQLHRARQGQPGELPQLLARRRSRMSRGEAKRRFTLADHRAATEGVECRKDRDVIDETPAAYKDIDAVMAAQQDLVEVVHTLKQVVCVKG
jgi:tRNA-splicing ligase RtcB